MIWSAAGWRAAVRALRGQPGWAKTDRVAEGPATPATGITSTASPAPATIIISTGAPASTPSTAAPAPATAIPGPASPATTTKAVPAAPFTSTPLSPAQKQPATRRRIGLAVTPGVLARATTA